MGLNVAWDTFDTWTLTRCTQRTGVLYTSGQGGHDFTTTTGLTTLNGTWQSHGSTLVGRADGGAPFFAKSRVDRGRVQNGRVRARLVVCPRFAAAAPAEVAFYGRGQDTNDRDFYSAEIRPNGAWLGILRSDNDGAPTLLGSTAYAYVAGTTANVFLSFDSGGVSAVDETNSVTVARVADTTYTAEGNIGILTRNVSDYDATSPDWIEVINSTVGGSARSTTFDAGSSQSADVLTCDVSLPAGATATCAISGVASGAPSFATTVTLSTGLNAYTFAAVTGRYWQVSLSMGGTTTHAFKRPPQIAKGNDAGGGGSTTILQYRSGGGGASSPRRRTVVLTEGQLAKIRAAAKRGMPWP